MVVSKNQGAHFGSHYNKDHIVLESILGLLILGSFEMEPWRV